MSRAERVQVGIGWVIRGVLAYEAIFAGVATNWPVAFTAVMALAASFLPALLERNLRLQLPIEFELIIVFFVFATLFLGEGRSFYARFGWWDNALHTGSGVVMGFVGFLVLYTLQQHERLQMKPMLLCTFSFAFALAAATLWEIFEFTMDSTFGFTMQKSGLDDTMADLIVGGAGAMFAVGTGYLFLVRRHAPLGWFEYMLERYCDENPEDPKPS
mgnify:CR=1 FL=1